MWLHQLNSLQVRDGNIYTSLPIPKPVVSSRGFFSEDTQFETQPVLTYFLVSLQVKAMTEA